MILPGIFGLNGKYTFLPINWSLSLNFGILTLVAIVFVYSRTGVVDFQLGKAKVDSLGSPCGAFLCRSLGSGFGSGFWAGTGYEAGLAFSEGYKLVVLELYRLFVGM